MFIFAAGAPAPTSAATPAAATSAAVTPAQKVIAKARTKLGRPWVHYAVGPNAFDCSGLVYYVFKSTGYVNKIGGRMSARGYYSYFRKRGLASTTNPKPGDLVVWGGGSHIGIYIGNGYAISTLTSGVRIHKVHAVTAPFTTYLHTGMSGLVAAKPAVTPSTAKAVGVRYTTTRVNFRFGVGTRTRVLSVLAKNTKLAVLATGHDTKGRIWLKVRRSPTATGWVAGWLTRTTPVAS
ncbi:MAG TPA: NlpC/P60 family protein [Candidatus Limnocylindrales bacterium]